MFRYLCLLRHDEGKRAGAKSEGQQEAKVPIKDHTAALHQVMQHLQSSASNDIRSSMRAVGHR
jgi:acetate kinase